MFESCGTDQSFYMRDEAKRQYDRAYYAARSKEQKLRKYLLQKERTAKNLRAIREYKAASGCVDCGEKDPIVLEFDHRTPADKEITIGDCTRLGWSIQRLMEEIRKCDVVCANCHRRRTAKQLKWR